MLNTNKGNNSACEQCVYIIEDYDGEMELIDPLHG